MKIKLGDKTPVATPVVFCTGCSTIAGCESGGRNWAESDRWPNGRNRLDIVEKLAN